MKFERMEDEYADDTAMEDSQDNLDCFGEFCKTDDICTRYCSASIQCAVEHTHNPGLDLFEELLILNYYPARMQ